MNKKEMKKIIVDDSLMANIAKQLEIFNKKQLIEFNKKKDYLWRNKKKGVKVKEKHFGGVNINSLNIVTGTPKKGFRTSGIYINEKGEIKKMKEKTVKKAVRDLIISYSYSGNMEGVFDENTRISNWEIEHAHSRHQMSGLRELRALRAEFKLSRWGHMTAYFITKNKYYMGYAFLQWLKDNYKD